MKFEEAAKFAKEGKRIKRKDWGGYWFIEDGKWVIHLKTGEELREAFTSETINNTLCDDWEVMPSMTKKEKLKELGYVINPSLEYYVKSNDEDNVIKMIDIEKGKYSILIKAVFYEQEDIDNLQIEFNNLKRDFKKVINCED